MLSFLYCLCSEKQNNFSKKVTSSRYWTWDPRTLGPLASCFPDWANLACVNWEIFNFTFVGSAIDFLIKLKSEYHGYKDLNSLSLTSNVKLAQSVWYESVHRRVSRFLGSRFNPYWRYLLYWNYFLFPIKQYKNDNIASYVHYEKTR